MLATSVRTLISTSVAEELINPNPLFRNGGRDVPRGTMAATVEALIGAVYVDSGENLRAVKVAMKGLGLSKPQE